MLNIAQDVVCECGIEAGVIYAIRTGVIGGCQRRNGSTGGKERDTSRHKYKYIFL